MGIDVTATTEIERSPEDVSAFAMEAENDTLWIGGISAARRLTPKPTAVGTRVERVASFMGKRIDYVMEVAELEPDRKVVLRSVKSPFPMKVTYTFEPTQAGTRASVRVEGEPGGFYKLAGPLMGRAVRKNITSDVKRLKSLMEGART